MTSATIRPARGGRVERQGYGMVVFASVMLLVIGCFNLIYGIAAVANAHVFVAGAHYVWGDLRFWGWATLIIGAVQLLAAAGVLAGNQLARWFGVAVLGINAIAMMFFLPAVGAGDPRRRRGRAVGAVRLRQPRQHRSRLAPTVRERPQPIPWGAAAKQGPAPHGWRPLTGMTARQQGTDGWFTESSQGAMKGGCGAETASWMRTPAGRCACAGALASRPASGRLEVADFPHQPRQQRTERAALGDRIPPAEPANTPPRPAPARCDLSPFASLERAAAEHPPHRWDRLMWRDALRRLIEDTHRQQ